MMARSVADTHRPLVAIFRGGWTGESVISHQSASQMLQVLDRSRFEPVVINIDRDDWTCQDVHGDLLRFDRGTCAVDRGNGPRTVDMALIAIHGPPGEDGPLQGYLDLLGIPYQTGGVLAMALTFSKWSTTALLRQLGMPVAVSVLITQQAAIDTDRILDRVGLPCFVKPDRSGSSLGISKVKEPSQLKPAIQTAFREGRQVMVEQGITGRELTCGVIALDGRVRALPICEVRTTREFFDYEAKYHATDTQELIPAPIPEAVAELVRQRSMAIFSALDLRGMVRVDHIWRGDEQAPPRPEDLVTIEVNTTPGFSAASIIPKMLAADGIGAAGAINGLVDEGLRTTGH